MKTRRHALTKKAAMLYAALGVLALAGDSIAAEICEISFTACPEGFHNDTLFVDTSVVAFSADMFVCDPREVIEAQFEAVSPPSIVFVIDHSASMMGIGKTYPGYDTWGARYEVTKDLLDTIAALYPEAEVGVVVFREVLFFDHRNNRAFSPLEGFGDQSYLPLVQLNRIIENDKTGMDIIKEVLATDTVIGRRADMLVEHVDLRYRPDFPTVGNTNINVAFLAAQRALQDASNPVENQFIIFLSDGEPHNPPDGPQEHGGLDKNWFTSGEGMPTTFTVYFTRDEEAPLSLQVMTENIRHNEYSKNNPYSALWAMDATYERLMDLLVTRFVTPLLLVVEATPRQVLVNSTYMSTLREDESFLFPDPFPLMDDVTPFSLDITYRLREVHTGKERDTVITISFHVTRTPGAALISGTAVICRELPTIGFFYNGTQVHALNETMERVEVRFFPRGNHYDSVTVELHTTQGTSPDRETLRLQPDSSWWSASFVRVIATGDPAPGNDTLQHFAFDTIAAVFRNPVVRADSARAVVPFAVSRSTIVRSVSWFDINADGYVDSMHFLIDGLEAGTEPQALLDVITLPAYRQFSVTTAAITATGLSVQVNEQRTAEPVTRVTAADTVTVSAALVTGGGWVQPAHLLPLDRMAPVIVSASLTSWDTQSGSDTLSVVFSETPVAFSASNPFSFFSSQRQQSYAATVQTISQNGENWHGVILSTTHPDGIAPGDSIWINPTAQVSDPAANAQSHPRNRRVELDVTIKREPVAITVATANNPLDPDARGAQPVPPFLLSLPALQQELANSSLGAGSAQYGTIISAGPVDPEKTGRSFYLNGSLSIYDVVNNPVLVNRPMAFDDDPQRPPRVYYVWDGRNRNGRYVATGTYMAVISVTDDQGVTSIQTVRLGVKR